MLEQLTIKKERPEKIGLCRGHYVSADDLEENTKPLVFIINTNFKTVGRFSKTSAAHTKCFGKVKKSSVHLGASVNDRMKVILSFEMSLKRALYHELLSSSGPSLFTP